jgi:hypothetical protein
VVLRQGVEGAHEETPAFIPALAMNRETSNIQHRTPNIE